MARTNIRNKLDRLSEAYKLIDSDEPMPSWEVMEVFIACFNNHRQTTRIENIYTLESWWYCPNCDQNWIWKTGAVKTDKKGKYLGKYNNTHYTLLARKSKYPHKLCKRCKIREANNEQCLLPG